MPVTDWDLFGLLLINGNNFPLADQLFGFITSKVAACLVLLIIIIYLRINQTYQLLLILLGLIIFIAVGDYVASALFKPWVGRLRPSHNPAILPLLHLVGDYRGGEYGFFSSHATNAACALAYLWHWIKHRWLRVGLIVWVILFGISRIYLGVHFPSDVLIGWLFGCCLGWSGFKLWSKLFKTVKSG